MAAGRCPVTTDLIGKPSPNPTRGKMINPGRKPSAHLLPSGVRLALAD
ncbi:MAG: hypothetical protein KatS3mg111_2337 [Pirellulaceae bacterium]|nr:MAG: hypothetical protein KatS3mg111_2337 [Pirellulaceae bacterium]